MNIKARLGQGIEVSRADIGMDGCELGRRIDYK